MLSGQVVFSARHSDIGSIDTPEGLSCEFAVKKFMNYFSIKISYFTLRYQH